VPRELALPTGDLMQPRPVTVHRFELLWRDGDRAGLEIECSAGTYVRQLVADLGDAYCEELERTAIGRFPLQDADEERLLPLGRALDFLPERALAPEEAERASHGVAVPGEDSADHVRLTHEGRLIAIAEPRGHTLKPTVVLVP
jgi:tRNA pseudouridine55 synthase